jgi:S-adenosylmethionine hydrolase
LWIFPTAFDRKTFERRRSRWQLHIDFFPKGTVHVAVVDPGVGSERKAIAVRTKDYFFVGPDNGLLSWALAKQSVRAIHRLENKNLFLPFVSQTFQGRDVFAPVAAHLSKGVAIAKVGPREPSFNTLPFPAPIRSRMRKVEDASPEP